MKINVKKILLLIVFICIGCTGSAGASNVVGLDISFSPQAPFSPGEQVTVTATVSPAQSGAYVELQSEFGGYFASGYTDDNGKFTGVYTVPDNALELVEHSSQTGSIAFTAICQPPQNDQWAQSLDYYCNIVPPAPVGVSQSFSPEPPFWPGEHVDVTATIEPIQAGIHVKLQSEYDGNYFAEGYTDSNGKFTGVYIVPDDALEWIQHAGEGDSIRFTAVCPEANSQSADIPCKIVAKPASTVTSISMPSFNPQPPFWPGEKVDVTASVYPPQAGVRVRFQSEYDGNYFAEGYTDSNGKFTAAYIVPNDALEWIQHAGEGTMRFSADCPEESIPYSGDVPCKIIPKPAEEPQIPEFPSIVVPVVAVLGMIAIVGHKKM